MKRYIQFYSVLLLFVFIASCKGQKKTSQANDSINQPKQSENNKLDVDPYFIESQSITSPYGPSSITRNILQDSKDNIWLATWEGIIRYDGETFTNFTNKEGLRRFHAFCGLEDSKGNIWFGTIGAGVYRYDPSAKLRNGSKFFTNFTTKDGLVNDRLGCIYEDKAGNIWFGTEGGVSKYDPSADAETDSKLFQNFTTKDGLTDNDINSIIEDKTGKFWFGTRGNACSYDGETFTLFTTEKGVPFDNVRSIIEDKKGNIWLGGNSGLWRFDPSAKLNGSSSSLTQFTKNFVGYIYEDKRGNIWTSSASNSDGNGSNWELSRYDMISLSSGKLTSTQIKTEQNMFFGIFEDKKEGIWIGNLNGVYRYDGKSFKDFKQIHSTKLNPSKEQYSNMVGKWSSISIDEEGFETLELFEDGNYTFKAGSNNDSGQWSILDVLHLSLDDVKYRFFFKGKNLVLEDERGNKYELTKPSFEQPLLNTDGQISAFVRRIFQDESGDLWFGTNGDGVIRYNGNSLEYFSLEEGFGGRAVRGIVEDAAGNVWFGTSGGLTKYDPSALLKTDAESFTNYTEKDGLINNDVWSITIDSKGIIWIATLQGISRFNGEEFTPFVLPESEPDELRGVTSAKIVHSIMEDSKGQMWFGTNGGAYIYDGESLSNISEEDGLCNNSVNCILEDKKGNIWFATHHKGVCRYDGTTFIHITTEEGVHGIEAWDLYEDKSGDIWFPMEGFGVYRYNSSVELKAGSKSFTNFHKEQGLASSAIQCAFEDKEGRLWFGGWMGLFRYDGTSFFSVTKLGPWQ